ncbi:unnamed protein product [Onchocerca flexuosa]|uniref:TPK_catalytic domain-containing protein n=1 Tax=Onchocerca flexuosa TaxID=387005 RepID=A0A183I2C0_9BILA|nr:unnamed protein product [Onchocerca flexuosa]
MLHTLEVVIFGESDMKRIQLLTPLLNEDAIGVLWVNSPPEQSSTKLAQHLWNKSRFRSCTDGAANFIMPLVKSENYLKPNLISGDFDSITIVARKFFESQVEIVETADQDYTDMCKALKIIAERIRNKKLNISKVIVLGGLSGRFDHVLSSLHSLLRFDSCEIAIIDGVNLVTILGEQILNQDKTELAFGKLISTSNEMVSDAISITCTAPVIFTMELSENALSLQ